MTRDTQVQGRVLYFNWAPYFREPVVGGGISVYLRGLNLDPPPQLARNGGS